MIFLVPAGSGWMMLQGGPVAMSLQSTLIMLGAAILGASGYYCIVQAMRIGDVEQGEVDLSLLELPAAIQTLIDAGGF